ncbi:MAG: hypothetical protein ABS77_11360, partial [Phenylobacterium sp. SCN 69-14]
APREAAPAETAPDAGRLAGFSVADGRGGALDLEGFLAATDTDGLLVLKDGRAVFETYRQGLEPQRPHILMSATKAVIGLLAGALHGAGLLDLDAPIEALAREAAGGPFAGASVRQLLDMRAGVRLSPQEAALYAGACGWDPPASGFEGVGLAGFFAGLKGPPAQHGGPFAYVSANIDLLGLAIEESTGRRVAELIEELIWRPMGAASPAWITLAPDGTPRCTGGVCATLQDFARLGQVVADGGRAGAAQIVPQAWIEDLMRGGDKDAWAKGEWGGLFTKVHRQMSCRAGWYVTHDTPGTLFAMGIHGQNLFVDIARRIVIAKLSSQPAPFDYAAAMLTQRGAAALAKLA